MIAILKIQDLGPLNPGPYSVYHATSEWLTRNTRNHEHVLDLTGWPLYFSQLQGYNFANVYEAPADPTTRWIVVRQPHVDRPLVLQPGHPRSDRRPRAGRAGPASGHAQPGADPDL